MHLRKLNFNSQVNKLSNAIFLVAIPLLLLNDFFLKAKYGNWLTGKISDFVGLYAFTFFFIALWPRFKRTIVSVVSLSFLFWKSSYSEQLLVFVKSLNIPLERTFDLTDLIALPVVLLAATHFDKMPRRHVSKLASILLICLSSFAFMATSYVEPTTPEQTNAVREISSFWPREVTQIVFRDITFHIPVSKESFKDRLSKKENFRFSSHWPNAPIFLVPFN